ncbi:MAG: hypothetical protein ACKO6K_05070, partial [Chitinophagaceae bacterium]
MKTVLLATLAVVCLATLSFAQGRRGEQPSRSYPRLVVDDSRSPRSQAQGLFQKYFDLRSEDALKAKSSSFDELGFTHDAYQQYYKQVKVEGAIYTVHSRRGIIESLSGEFREIRNVEVAPVISATQAFQLAKLQVGASVYAWEDKVKQGYPDYKFPQGELVIMGGGEADRYIPTLAWKFDIYAVEPLSRAYVYINAQTGALVTALPLIHTTNAPSSGTTLYNGVVNFTADYTGSLYRLSQTASGGG